jgi:hypothetical protein
MSTATPAKTTQQTGFRLSKKELRLLDKIRRKLETANPGLKFNRIDAVRAAIRYYDTSHP